MKTATMKQCWMEMGVTVTELEFELLYFSILDKFAKAELEYIDA